MLALTLVSGLGGGLASVATAQEHVLITEFSDLGDVAKALEEALGEASTVKPVWRPTTTTDLDEDKAGTMLKLISALEDDDDVQEVYANFEIADDIMERLAEAS